MYPITPIINCHFCALNLHLNLSSFKEKVLQFFVNNIFRLDYEISKLTPFQQTLVFIIAIIATLLIASLLVAIIINVFGFTIPISAEESRQLNDKEIQRKIKRKQQLMADRKRAENHRPFRIKLFEFLYQLFR